ncbi:hypothetical protein SKB0092_45170 (plasmid) [Roseomonas mucosa]
MPVSTVRPLAEPAPRGLWGGLATMKIELRKVAYVARVAMDRLSQLLCDCDNGVLSGAGLHGQPPLPSGWDALTSCSTHSSSSQRRPRPTGSSRATLPYTSGRPEYGEPS